MDWSTSQVSVQRWFWCSSSIVLEKTHFSSGSDWLTRRSVLGGFNLWFSSWFSSTLNTFSTPHRINKDERNHHTWPSWGVWDRRCRVQGLQIGTFLQLDVCQMSPCSDPAIPGIYPKYIMRSAQRCTHRDALFSIIYDLETIRCHINVQHWCLAI
jgi:hypothetical protein